jgi:AcrR family transcriptional regulator
MRTLATRLGVRASSLYRHFPDRLSIENTLADRYGRQLLDRMEQSIQGLNGERALFAASRVYLDFASSESAFYDMLMRICVPPAPQTEVTQAIWKFFVRLVSETTQLGEDTAGATAFWSFLHGFSLLERAGHLGEPTASRLTFARGTQALVRGLSVGHADVARSQS